MLPAAGRARDRHRQFRDVRNVTHSETGGVREIDGRNVTLIPPTFRLDDISPDDISWHHE